MTARTVSILLADDHDVVRAGVRSMLETHEGWVVCGETGSASEAVQLAGQLSPDIVVLDLELEESSGLSAAAEIKQLFPTIEVLIFSVHDEEHIIRDAMSAGVSAFVLKSEGGRSLMEAIQCAVDHKPFLPPRASEILLREYRLSPRTQSNATVLTDREREIVQLLAIGKSNKEAAQTLGISVKTVETHRAAIMRKLHLGSVVSLVRYAVREHLITP